MSAEINSEVGFKFHNHDRSFQESLRRHLEKHSIDAEAALFHFPVLARRQWLKRFLAHAELFKMTTHVPGDILEVGVFRGLGLLTWANLLEIYCLGDRTKVVWGLENWAGFQEFSEQDGAPIESAGKHQGGFDPSSFRSEVLDAVQLFDSDRFVPWKPRIQIVDGDAGTAIADLLHESPGVRFSLVHFDVDLYAPTLAVLEHVWSRVPVGGVLIFDEYGIADWPGESQAVDEFLQRYPTQQLQTFAWTNAPGAFLVKQPS